jgi:hypothetical protein
MHSIGQEKLLTRILVPLVALLFAHCQVSQLAGAGVETTNGSVAGTVVRKTGSPCPYTQVKLFPADYDPVKDTGSVPVDTTDITGRYSFTNIGSGHYTVVAVQIDDKTRSFVKGVVVAADTVMVPADTLHRPGTINVILPSGLNVNYGYLYIPGTTIYSLLSDNNGSVVLDSVPAGASLSIFYAIKGNSAQPQVVRDCVIVAPGGMTTIDYIEWKFSKKLIFNTTASGANVAGDVVNFPVLVRLNAGNFNFSQAQGNGNDIRFAKANGTPLPYEIERWNSANGGAEIWVKADTVYGNDSTHFITMYWGNPNATSASNSAVVFDTSNAFQGVWHLGESSGPTAKDATGNHYNGTKLGSTLPVAADGAVGTAQEFDGSSSFIQMIGTADSKLNFPVNGFYSVSAWVFVDTLVDSTTHVIASKGHEQYYLKLYWDVPHWEFAEYHDKVGWQVSSYSPAQVRTWKFLVGVRNGNNQYLYLDGVLVNNGYGVALDTSLARNTTDDFSIGKYLRYAVFTGQGFCWFDGKIDEVRVSSRSLTADWIKLCYMNQKEPDALIK